MHLGKLTRSISLPRASAALARKRAVGVATLAMALSTAAFANGRAAVQPPVPTNHSASIPLFTADPRPAPMGPTRVAQSLRTSSVAPEAGNPAESGHGAALRALPTAGASVDMAAAR